MYWFNCKVETLDINAIWCSCIQCFYEFYISGLKMTKLGQNVLPQWSII